MITSGFFALLSTILFFTSYMENDSSFPKPLTAEDELAMILKAKEGERAAYDSLVKHNMRLVVHIAKKYTNYHDIEELISVGAIGLIKGIKTYSPDKKTVLATYCARCIENEMLMAIRASKKFKNDVSLNDPIGTDKDGNELNRSDIIAEPGKSVIERVEEKMNNERLREVIKAVLDEREYQIIMLRYGLDGCDPLTQKEVAAKYLISRSYVSRIEKRALAKIKNSLMEEGFSM